MKFTDECPEREDVLIRGWAPTAVRKFMVKVGGLNPFGEKNYRIVLAQSIRELHGGRWIDWPKNASLQQMGGMILRNDPSFRKHVIALTDKNLPPQELRAEVLRLVPSDQQPLRAVEEMRLVQRYPHHEGWMLQCWRPPDQFGDKGWWEAQTVPGRADLPILGPFPSKGAYEAIDHFEMENGIEISRTTYKELPELTALETGIQFMEDNKYREREGASPEARILIRLHDYQAALKAANEKAAAERSMQISEALTPYLSQSLEGGRLRTQLAEESGMRQHVGN